MTAKLYKTMVGAFVVGGIALFTVALVLLGGGKLFSNAVEYVLYFDGSVSGLSIGAPVVFRGVPMGSVTQISLVANSRDSNVTIPVTIRIDEKSFIRANGQTLSEEAQQEIIRRMVERGLRARLQMSSLITGQYRVELDFFPNTPMNFRSSSPDSEIPTVPSPVVTLQRKFARLPIEEIVNSLTNMLHNITDAVGEGQLKAGIEEFTGAFKEVRAFMSNGKLRETIESVLSQFDNASGSVSREVPALLSSFRSAMNNIAAAAEKMGKVAVNAGSVIESSLSRDSPTMNELRRLLQEAIAAARAIRNFTDMLERNPEALIRGRQGTR